MSNRTPHDTLFRFTFRQPENAAAWLQSCLPERIVRRVDWGSLQLTSGSHVDAGAEWRHSDLVFSVKIDQREALIVVLVEHQSSVDVWMPLRMLGYVMRLWEQHVREHPESQRLPAVLPVVAYHGAVPWHAATSVHELIDLDAVALADFAPFLPQLRFQLDDLTAHGEAQLHARELPSAAKLTLLSLVCFPRRGALDVLRNLAQLLASLPHDAAGRDAMTALLCYVVAVANPAPNPQQVVELFDRHVHADASEVVMTLAELWEQQGMERGLERGEKLGLERGEKLGLERVLLELLRQKFGSLSGEVIARVHAASTEDLSAYFQRVLTAQDISDIFDPEP